MDQLLLSMMYPMTAVALSSVQQFAHDDAFVAVMLAMALNSYFADADGGC